MITLVATKRSVLIERLALARKKKAAKNPPGGISSPVSAKKAPDVKEDPPVSQIVSNPERELEDRMRALLDDALEYNDKADPSGRIHELEDWKVQRRGRSNLAQNASRAY